MPDNTIIGGYGDLYLLAERAGTAVGLQRPAPVYPGSDGGQGHGPV